MNIFYLSENPKEAAIFHLDKHVVKMILETAQLLCTAHRFLDGVPQTIQKTTKSGSQKPTTRLVMEDPALEEVLYKTTHVNHPCAIWCRANINNYMWLYELFVALCDEYTHRYGKKHKTDTLLRDTLKIAPKAIPNAPFTTPAQAMPEEYRNPNPVIAYRNYYVGAKAKFAVWTLRETPSWFGSN